ncbi:nucleotidyl transferase AbiEii/AbiGii toxin family protein [Cryptosporangium sp. NPDC048952]|uniref:nucleotidyl transferase AbiEii/AbiGii toxin family protein n=1 Tax=Cryptosporangium sp. NPDC048952 TaxID=3363961 RepID=UPI003716D9AC
MATDEGAEWVLKGGAALEFRLRERARTTKDLDVAARLGCLKGDDVRSRLIEAISPDLDGDGFVFRAAQPTDLSDDLAGRGAWRFTIRALLAGRLFATIKLDVVARSEEIAVTEQLSLPNTLDFAGTPPRSIEAVDRRQHFAEKLHALTRDYGNRANTRVKDLADLVLLIESGLLPDSSLVAVVRHVFDVRGTHALPRRIADPPLAWASQYPGIAEKLTDSPPTVSDAMAVLRDFWDAAHLASPTALA